VRRILLPITMSSSRPKKVHYERGTKGGRSTHRSSASRDSGVGSSSDRASLGTDEDSPSGHRETEDQRHILRSVQEALDAALDRIKKQESEINSLDVALRESNRENRLLKREKQDLLNKVDDLMQDLDDQKRVNERLKRDSRGSIGSDASSSREEKRSSDTPPSPTSPRRDPRPYLRSSVSNHDDPPQQRARDDDWPRYRGGNVPRSSASAGYSAASMASPVPPRPNPFEPISSAPPLPTRPYVGRGPALPVYAMGPVSPVVDAYPNDGNYHPYPLR